MQCVAIHNTVEITCVEHQDADYQKEWAHFLPDMSENSQSFVRQTQS
jgi:DNA polymerase II large subunit